MSRYVIEPMKIDELEYFFTPTAKKTIQFIISKSIFGQPELLSGQQALPIHVPKENIEQWIVQSLDVEPVGAGSYLIDVIKKSKDESLFE